MWLYLLVIPSDMMSVILQQEEIILILSLSTTSTYKTQTDRARCTKEFYFHVFGESVNFQGNCYQETILRSMGVNAKHTVCHPVHHGH